MSNDNKTPANLKNTIIKSVAALLCTSLVSYTGSASLGALADAKKAVAEAGAPAGVSDGTVSASDADSGSESSVSDLIPTDNTSTDSVDVSEGTDTGADISADTPVSDVNTADTSSEKTEQTAKPAEDKNSIPQTKAEILSYCNTALNNAKAAKVGYTKVFVRKGGDNLPSVLQSIISQNKTTTAQKGSSGIKDDFPAAGFDWSSKLREQDVKSATLKPNGQYYEITIKLDKETNPGKGEASKYGRVMSVIDANDAKDMVPGIKSITMTYHDGYVYAKIDSKTGKLVKAEFSASADISASIAVLGDLKAENLISTETFTDIKW